MSNEVPARALREDTRQLVETIVAALEDKKAEGVVALQIGAVSSLAEVFVIASGSSQRHVETLIDEVREKSREIGQRPFGVEGQGTRWCLIDFGDVVVHVFDAEMREYYDLERLWLDAPRIDTSSAESAVP